MPALLRAITLVVTVAVGSLAASPSGAESDAERRDEVRRNQAELAAELDVLLATDGELEAAVAALDTYVAAQSAEVDGARQALEVAELEVAVAQERVTEMRTRIEDLRQEARMRAVEAYMHPDGDWFDEVASATDSTEAVLRRALLADIAGSRADVVDELGRTEDDLEVAERDAEEARAAVDRRREEGEAILAQLQATRAEQADLQQALEARIAEFQAEADALAGAEAELTARIIAATAPLPSGDNVDAPASASGLIWPVSGTVTSGFGMRWGRMHEGIDIAAPSGSPVWAANDGTVISAGWDGGYGQNIIVDHGGGFVTVYAHNSSILVSAGQSVSRGQQIGVVGCTGSCTGPHVHFETRVGGVPYNPIQFLP